MAEVFHGIFTAIAASLVVVIVLMAVCVVAAGLLAGWRDE